MKLKFILIACVAFATVPAATSCAEVKPIARTVNDAARIACETAFGEEELPQGVTPEQLCDAHENLQPFIRSILAAKQTVLLGANGIGGPEEDSTE